MGFCLTPRYGKKHFDHIEKMINRLIDDGKSDIYRLWGCQTLGAMCVPLEPYAKPLPDTYAVTTNKTFQNAVIRHYVGIPEIRPRYFIEGVPKLLADFAQ
jgi:hypothetical protein